MFRRFAVALVLASVPASASGFYFGENGSKALLTGGAFAGEADDLSAIQHNPGGLSQLSGFHFLVDSALFNHDVRFQRREPDGTPFVAQEVKNNGGLFFAPFVGVGYGLTVAEMPLTIAAGLYGPPSVGRYNYPRPNYEKNNPEPPKVPSYVESPKKFAPQRYSLINNDVVILYPSLSVSLAPTSKISAGVSLQYVVSSFSFSQSIYSALSTPPTMRDEDPEFDSLVSVQLQGKGGYTGILGVLVKPTDRIAIGASARPPVQVNSHGKFIIEPGEQARNFGTTVTCPGRIAEDVGTVKEGRVICPDGADLSLTLPWEIKVGTRIKPTGKLGINVDFVYQGWQSLGALVLTPNDITIQLAGNEPQPVSQFIIPKHWHHAISVRGGVSYDFDFGLTLRGGGWYETSASPDAYAGIDFAHFDRVILTGGAGYKVGPMEFLVGGAFSPNVTKEVTTSDARAGQTDPEIQGQVVGNGTYNSSGFILTAGIRGSFGGGPKAAAIQETSP
jgi:long-subunit fatty acid transport protein